MDLSTERTLPPLLEANKLESAHSKTFCDFLSEDTIKYNMWPTLNVLEVH